MDSSLGHILSSRSKGLAFTSEPFHNLKNLLRKAVLNRSYNIRHIGYTYARKLGVQQDQVQLDTRILLKFLSYTLICDPLTINYQDFASPSNFNITFPEVLIRRNLTSVVCLVILMGSNCHPFLQKHIFALIITDDPTLHTSKLAFYWI